jgi:hypothetical protein
MVVAAIHRGVIHSAVQEIAPALEVVLLVISSPPHEAYRAFRTAAVIARRGIPRFGLEEKRPVSRPGGSSLASRRTGRGEFF